MTDATGKLARWLLGSSEFGFKVVLRTEVKHQALDVLSSLNTTGMDEYPIEDYVPVLTVTKRRQRLERQKRTGIVSAETMG